jgi:hypothetical protein
MDGEINAYVLEMLWATGLLIMWRKTYKLIAGYWPTAPGGRPFKGEMNGTPKLVFSRTLERVDWLKFRLATGSIAEEVAGSGALVARALSGKFHDNISAPARRHGTHAIAANRLESPPKSTVRSRSEPQVSTGQSLTQQLQRLSPGRHRGY